jgi:hypothetical protein
MRQNRETSFFVGKASEAFTKSSLSLHLADNQFLMSQIAPTTDQFAENLYRTPPYDPNAHPKYQWNNNGRICCI